MTESHPVVETRAYYTRAFTTHGVSPRGVDWNSEYSQIIRFERLCTPRVLASDDLLDFGCGYGALLDYLRARGWKGKYTGVDLVPSMIETARDRFRNDDRSTFHLGSEPIGRHSTVIANGVLNVRGKVAVSLWRKHVHALLEAMFTAAETSVAFNFLHPWSDTNHKRRHLWYPRGLELVDLTANRFSRWLEVDQAYELYETTVRAFRI